MEMEKLEIERTEKDVVLASLEAVEHKKLAAEELGACNGVASISDENDFVLHEKFRNLFTVDGKNLGSKLSFADAKLKPELLDRLEAFAKAFKPKTDDTSEGKDVDFVPFVDEQELSAEIDENQFNFVKDLERNEAKAATLTRNDVGDDTGPNVASDTIPSDTCRQDPLLSMIEKLKSSRCFNDKDLFEEIKEDEHEDLDTIRGDDKLIIDVLSVLKKDGNILTKNLFLESDDCFLEEIESLENLFLAWERGQISTDKYRDRLAGVCKEQKNGVGSLAALVLHRLRKLKYPLIHQESFKKICSLFEEHAGHDEILDIVMNETELENRLLISDLTRALYLVTSFDYENGVTLEKLAKSFWKILLGLKFSERIQGTSDQDYAVQLTRLIITNCNYFP